MEKAPAFLGEEFGRVEVAELPGTITVRGPEPVIAHMASYRAWAEQHDVPFDRARTLVADGIARSGAYEITCLGGILLCRW
ncbi:hypothetical protein [Streptomyces goshikiensis]|uniref:hypothetical protein n=1 Tax=Streptomyces goshikiensis TaxID=1942 RepID=UPI0036C85977